MIWQSASLRVSKFAWVTTLETFLSFSCANDLVDLALEHKFEGSENSLRSVVKYEESIQLGSQNSPIFR